jgi:hypothetical protein
MAPKTNSLLSVPMKAICAGSERLYAAQKAGLDMEDTLKHAVWATDNSYRNEWRDPRIGQMAKDYLHALRNSGA